MSRLTVLILFPHSSSTISSHYSFIFISFLSYSFFPSFHSTFDYLCRRFLITFPRMIIPSHNSLPTHHTFHPSHHSRIACTQTQTFTYHVNPNFEEYRTKASYDVSHLDDDDNNGAYADDLKKPLSQNDLDLEKELVGELSMFSDDYDRNFDDTEPVVVSTELWPG